MNNLNTDLVKSVLEFIPFDVDDNQKLNSTASVNKTFYKAVQKTSLTKSLNIDDVIGTIKFGDLKSQPVKNLIVEYLEYKQEECIEKISHHGDDIVCRVDSRWEKYEKMISTLTGNPPRPQPLTYWEYVKENIFEKMTTLFLIEDQDQRDSRRHFLVETMNNLNAFTSNKMVCVLPPKSYWDDLIAMV